MTTVYRLEQEDGTGCYRGDLSLNVEHDIFRHPLPRDDSLLMDNLDENSKHFIDFHFGFASVDQLRTWFYNDEWIRKIAKNGNVLSVYEAEEVYLGNTQVCFNRDTAKLIIRHDVLEFFKLPPIEVTINPFQDDVRSDGYYTKKALTCEEQ